MMSFHKENTNVDTYMRMYELVNIPNHSLLLYKLAPNLKFHSHTHAHTYVHRHVSVHAIVLLAEPLERRQHIKRHLFLFFSPCVRILPR